MKKNDKKEKKFDNEDDDYFSDFLGKMINKIFKSFKNFNNPILNLDSDIEVKDFPNIKDFQENSFIIEYGTGMDKPLIKINGIPIEFDENIWKNILNEYNNIEFNDFYDLGALKNANESITKNIDKYDELSLKKYETPYYEIIENPNHVEITLELPGVKKEDIIINYQHNRIIISADSEFKNYQKSFELKFTPNPSKTEIYGNNGIYQIILKN